MTNIHIFSPFHTGIYGFLPSSNIFHWLAHNVCDDEHPATEQLCANVFINLFGVESQLLNKSMISFYIDHLPAGCSTYSFAHYTQLKIAGNDSFSRYDWGPEQNMIKYGQATPPEMDLTKVTAATVLYIGDSDTAACVEDNEVLASRLPNLVESHIVDYEGWTHLDFFMAMNVKEKVYDSIVNYMNDMS